MATTRGKKAKEAEIPTEQPLWFKGVSETLSKLASKLEVIEKKITAVDDLKKKVKNHDVKFEKMEEKLENFTENLQLRILRRLDIESKVEEAIQLGKQIGQSILVKFASAATVRAIFKKGVLQKLQGTKISIHPDLPPEIREARRPWYPTLNKLKREGRKVYFKGTKLFCDGKVVERFSAESEASNSAAKSRYTTPGTKGTEEDVVSEAPLTEEEDTE